MGEPRRLKPTSHPCCALGMTTTKPVAVRPCCAEYERLEAEAKWHGVSPGALARDYFVRASPVIKARGRSESAGLPWKPWSVCPLCGPDGDRRAIHR